MNPITYRGNRSSGNQLVEVERLSNSVAIYNGISTASAWAAGFIGPERTRTTSHQRVVFSFRQPDMIISVGHLGGTTAPSGQAAPRESGGQQGIELRIYEGRSTVYIIHASASIAAFAAPFVFETTKFYQARTQIKNNRFYARVWQDGTPEPLEWLFSYPLPGALLTTGYNYINLYLPASELTGYRLDYYGADVTPLVSRWYGEVDKSIKFGATIGRPMVRRNDSVSRGFSMNFSSYPYRSRGSTSTSNMVRGTLTARGYKRINLKSGVTYVPAMSMKIIANVTPLRRRRSTVTRQIKSAALFNTKRVRKHTLVFNSTYTFIPRPQVIPEVSVVLNSFYDFNLSPVITKTGIVDISSTYTLSSTGKRRLTGKTETSFAHKIKVNVPGKITDEITLPITNELQSQPVVKLIDSASGEFTSNVNAEGFVATIHLGSVLSSMSSEVSAEGYISRSAQVNSRVSSNVVARGIRRTNSMTELSATFGVVLDRPDFEIVFEELIRKRAVFIHYACTRMGGTNIVVQYRHKRTMEAQSRTYFVAFDDARQPSLFGYSENLWDDDMIIVYVTDSLSDPIVSIINQEFNLGLLEGVVT